MSDVKEGSEIAKEIIRQIFGKVNGPDLDLIKTTLDNTYVVPKEKWKETEELIPKGLLYEGLVKDFHKEQWEHHQLNEKWQKIKTLIDNSPKFAKGFDGHHWIHEYNTDDIDKFLEELKKVMEE